MALLKCPECGNNVSDKADTCPKCGYPLKEYLEKQSTRSVTEDEKQPKKTAAQKNDTVKTPVPEHKTTNRVSGIGPKKIGAMVAGIVLIVAVIAIGVMFGSRGNDSEESQESATSTAQESASTEENVDKTSDANESVDKESGEDEKSFEKNKTVNAKATKESVVIMDEDNARIEFKGITEHNEDTYLLSLLIENKTNEKIMVKVSNFTVPKLQYQVAHFCSTSHLWCKELLISS